MKRRLFKYGEIVNYKGLVYKVEVDYEDLVYLIGMKNPVQPNEIKLV